MTSIHADATGYFGPESVSWQLYREPVVILGGPRALLLQIAHPAVADGVARFSNFRADALGRGVRTFRSMAMIYYGSRAQADATASRLHRVHTGIRGQYDAPAATPYRATDGHLMAWVLATLTDTSLLIFERYTPRHLPLHWREKFYEESCVAADLLGIPAGAYPESLSLFRQYFNDQLHSELLGSSPACYELAQAIVHHKYTPTAMAKLLAAGWMPDGLSQRLGVAVPNAHQRAEKLFSRLAVLYRFVPVPFRYSPAYFQAHARLARVSGGRQPVLGRVYDFISQKFSVPLGI